VKDLVIIGGGGHAKNVLSVAMATGFNVIGILDDDASKAGAKILGVPVIGSTNLLRKGIFERAVIAVGDNKKRQSIAETYSDLCEWAILIHPQSIVHSTCYINEGTVIVCGAVVQPDAIVGKHCIIGISASLSHDCFLGDFVHIAPGVRLTGGVRVEEGAFVGAGAVVIPQRTVGEWSIVGAGAVVTKDVRPYSKVAGVPAKEIGSGDSRKEE